MAICKVLITSIGPNSKSMAFLPTNRAIRPRSAKSASTAAISFLSGPAIVPPRSRVYRRPWRDPATLEDTTASGSEGGRRDPMTATRGRSRRGLAGPVGSLSSQPMVTLGVDLASQAKRTAVCLIRWDGESADVDCLRTDVTDSDLLDLFGRPCQGPDKIAIDAPFGWPEDFVRAIHTYSTSTVWRSVDDSHLRLRRTDRVVREKTRLVPLSVSADRIAMTAKRAARLLARVAGDGEAIDRSGGGRSGGRGHE